MTLDIAHAATRRRVVPSLWQQIIATHHDVVAPVLRVTLAIVMFPHGAQKLIGWFGGLGLDGTIAFMQSQFGIPLLLTVLVTAAEFFGSLALIAGFLTRISATAIASVMVGAIVVVHLQFGFFMNWFGANAGEGFEFHLLAIGLALALVIRGGGAWSMDYRLARLQP